MLMCFANVLCAFHFLKFVCLSLGIINISVYISINQFYAFVFKEGRSVVQVPVILSYYCHRVRGAINIY